jgi:hypothetical protein
VLPVEETRKRQQTPKLKLKIKIDFNYDNLIGIRHKSAGIVINY